MTALLTALLLAVTPPGGIGETVLVDPAPIAVATTGATRGTAVQVAPTDPPPATEAPRPGFSGAVSNGHCVGMEGLLAYYSPGWNVTRMSGIAYRESRCQPGASNSCCSGLLQVHRLWLPQPSCGAYSRSDLYDPATNVCVAAIVWRESGYGAWSTS